MKNNIFFLIIFTSIFGIKKLVDLDFIKKVDETNKEIVKVFGPIAESGTSLNKAFTLIAQVKLMIDYDLDFKALRAKLCRMAEQNSDSNSTLLSKELTQIPEKPGKKVSSVVNKLSSEQLFDYLYAIFINIYKGKRINSRYFPSVLYESASKNSIATKKNKENLISQLKKYTEKYLYIVCGNDYNKQVHGDVVDIQCMPTIPEFEFPDGEFFYGWSDISLNPKTSALILKDIKRKKSGNPVFNMFMNDVIESVAGFFAEEFEIKGFKIIEADNIVETGTVPLFRLMSLVDENKQDDFNAKEGVFKTGLKYEDFRKVDDPIRDYNYSISKTALTKSVGSKIADLLARLAKQLGIKFNNFYLKIEKLPDKEPIYFMEIHEEKLII